MNTVMLLLPLGGVALFVLGSHYADLPSTRMAERIYGDIKQPNQKLEYRYNYDYYDILNQQLLKGGIHLAGLLNEIFG